MQMFSMKAERRQEQEQESCLGSVWCSQPSRSTPTPRRGGEVLGPKITSAKISLRCRAASSVSLWPPCWTGTGTGTGTPSRNPKKKPQDKRKDKVKDKIKDKRKDKREKSRRRRKGKRDSIRSVCVACGVCATGLK